MCTCANIYEAECAKSKIFASKIWATKIFPITGSGQEQVAYAISRTILDTNMGY